MNTERAEVTEVWRERERLEREKLRQMERQGLIASLILLLGLSVGCFLAWMVTAGR